MNIQEEQKAFEAEVVANKIAPCLFAKWDGEKYVSSHSSKPYMQALFEVWLAAKNHMLEMQKPETVVYQEHSSNGVRWTSPSCCRSFKSEAEAVQWCKDKGYRVVEE